MTTVHIRYDLPEVRGNKLDAVCDHDYPDDREVAEILLTVLHANEVAPLSGISDKYRGEASDRPPRAIDVLARYGLSNVMYSVNGLELVRIRRE